jgi:hypothetical protein
MNSSCLVTSLEKSSLTFSTSTGMFSKASKWSLKEHLMDRKNKIET